MALGSGTKNPGAIGWVPSIAPQTCTTTFNGIAQGYAADRIVTILKRHGYRDALVNIGEFHGIGSREGGGPWRIGVADPITSANVATLDVSDNAVATSAPRGTLVRGQPHVFDPLDRPGARWMSVTVVADAAWRADAASTALAAAPATDSPVLLKRLGVQSAVLIAANSTVMRWKKNGALDWMSQERRVKGEK